MGSIVRRVDVPQESVSEEVEHLVQSGYSNIRLFKRADGRWTIEAGTDSTGPR
jgi:tRNA A37 methylthiotransferase MiaB